MADFIINDISFEVISNDALHAKCMNDTHIVNTTITYDTKEEALAAADAGLGPFGLTLYNNNIPKSVIAYRPDASARNPFGFLSIREKTAGTYPIVRNNVTLNSYTVASSQDGIIGGGSPWFPSKYTVTYASSDHEGVQYRIDVLPSAAFNDDGSMASTGSYTFGRVTVTYEVYKTNNNKWQWRRIIYCDTNGNASFSTISSAMSGLKPVDLTDPFSQGDESESIGSDVTPGSNFTGVGGLGSYTNPQFTGGVPSLPTLSAVDTGLLQLYCSPSAAGMNALAQFLWSSAFDVDTFKKLFTDPMDLIIGAAILPCTPTNTASVILFGNINTGVSMPKATTQYVAVDCGTLALTPRTGSFLDYAPHSKISIYLPYIGMRELNMTELVGKTIGVVYHVDVLTGACVAFVTANGVVLYEYSGSCAIQIPITSSNWASVLQSLATIGGSAIGGFAAGGPMGAVVAGGVSAASNAASGGLTPSFQRGGSVSGSAGLLADQNPYLVVELPNQCKASSQNWFEGYPNYTTMYLNQCEGYTKVHDINLEGIGCTRSELSEIETLLKGGVII